jgi:hypothetical protein
MAGRLTMLMGVWDDDAGWMVWIDAWMDGLVSIDRSMHACIIGEVCAS